MTSNSLGGQLWPRLELRVRVLWWEELDWPWEQVSAHALLSGTWERGHLGLKHPS